VADNFRTMFELGPMTADLGMLAGVQRLVDSAHRLAHAVEAWRVVVVDGVTGQLVVPQLVLVRPFRAEVSNLMKISTLLLAADLENSTTEKFLNFC
jgi:hypothetical protein